ncbi:MAG: DNA cytosine methyltransferase [Treponema sp.]|nr:DNA cytosine methyltransferase [Treponema sp.]MEE3435943.1 DNA cytosine methyltransferase [Treponema sp.]
MQKSKPLKFIDLFAGIGGFHIALSSLGGEAVFASEWDKDAATVYENNFKLKPAGDITKISEKSIPDHDILCAGFPCQAFSISGKQLGFEDSRGTLFFDVARIAKEKQPKVMFLENVKNLARHDGGKTLAVIKKTLDEIGYDVYDKVLDASKFGVPQSRKRIYIVCFRKDLKVKDFTFPKEEKVKKHVVDILLPDSETKKYEVRRNDVFMNDTIKEDFSDVPLRIGIVNKGGQGERIYSPLGTAITLSAYGGGAGAKTGLYRVNGRIRKLAPRECARLDGFPENFKIAEKDNIAYKQFGNSVVVDVLKKIMKSALEKEEVAAKL